MAANGTKVDRESHLRWVAIADMRVSPTSQRKYRRSHAEAYAADFHLEALGYPVLSLRDGIHFIVDGQHRVKALEMIGWGDQQIQCEVYEGLTEEQEAELFLERNNSRHITPYDKYRVALTAGRFIETDIDRTVRANGLRVSQDGHDGSTSAVTALRLVYVAGGPLVLGRALRLLRDSFGGSPPSLRGEVIQGMGMVCQRYNGAFDDVMAVERLRGLMGGVSGLLSKANLLQQRYGQPKPECIAASIVDVMNGARGKGGRRLEKWWKPEVIERVVVEASG